MNLLSILKEYLESRKLVVKYDPPGGKYSLKVYKTEHDIEYKGMKIWKREPSDLNLRSYGEPNAQIYKEYDNDTILVVHISSLTLEGNSLERKFRGSGGVKVDAADPGSFKKILEMIQAS